MIKMTKRIRNMIIIVAIMLTWIGINLFYYKTYGMDTIVKTEWSEDITKVVVKVASQTPPINTNWYTPTTSIESVPNASQVWDIGNSIIGCLQIIGSIASVTVLAILGMKYMIGSAEEKAEYKKTMGPYILGAIMVFAITNILVIIGNIAKNIL